ncbi:ArsR/SmtB family transcription factor [Brachyspira hampsonii]|uniref:ArsR/SmtB family transcription factor n=1 Tax=Brachyspira hampsonii TaxID=1287055 RepID=UPI0002AE0884|nr:metalloregulator ArsR/SmtB family transcription factor [Brachyspira hampsonii]ELV05999.1 ArsR family transcriptional regulator [Brachyspira hampsonii 30599]
MKKNIKKYTETSDEEYLNTDDDCEISTKDSNISSLIPKLPNDEEFSLLAGFFSVFSDSTRLKIISALSEKELCVHELSSLLDMKQPSISQHLKMLWQARVVKKRKVGLHVFYRLDDEHIEKIYTLGV